MNVPPSRVLITNCVVLNGGDAAILYGLLDRLRAALGPDIGVVIVDDQPEEVRTHYPELDTRPRLEKTFRPPPRTRVLGRMITELRRARLLAGAWCMDRGLAGLSRIWLNRAHRSALEAFRRSDVVVSTGGTYLVERYPIEGRLLELEVALAMRRPLVLFTQSLGPFQRRRHQRALRTIIPRARLVLLRDERSRRHLNDLGIAGGNVHVVADGAFALTARPVRGRHEELRVAVSVRDWPYAAGDSSTINDAYRDALAALTERLVSERGAEVTFLSTCQGTPEYWTDDSAVAAAVTERLDPVMRGSVHVDRSFHRPQELLEILGGFDLVVATRMHIAILALVAGVPVFPVAYEFKTRELFERLGLGDWVYDFEALGHAAFPDDVERFIDQLPASHALLQARVELERQSAIGTADLLVRALGVNQTPVALREKFTVSPSQRTLRSSTERIARRLRYVGWGVRCPICERTARRFAPYRGRPFAACVYCDSLERHRGLWLWLRNRIPTGAAVLHIAPEAGVAARLRCLPIDYVSTDLESPIEMRHDDITALPDATGSFDVVICNHVLEHIVDDRAAMREIFRVLRPGGFAVLQHPIEARPDTLEDVDVTSAQERSRVFGQEDHVRAYGWDFVDRLHEAGFRDVVAPEIEREIPVALYRRYGLRPSPTIIAVRATEP